MKIDYWQEGYNSALLHGKTYSENPYEGKEGATPWAFGCSEGMKEPNKQAFGQIMKALESEK